MRLFNRLRNIADATVDILLSALVLSIIRYEELIEKRNENR